MCAYAIDIAAACSPAHTTRATLGATRACLIPDELLERSALEERRAAHALGVPVEEFRAAQREHLPA